MVVRLTKSTAAVTSIQTFFFAPSIMFLGAQERIMKANIDINGKRRLHEVKRETHEKVRKQMNDPTLEGKDQNTVGRFQRKIGSAAKAVEK
jgi:hypothetical protein